MPSPTSDDVLPMWVICDKCKVKCDADDFPLSLQFMSDHVSHVFNGLRVMAKDFPCPNRQRDYAEV